VSRNVDGVIDRCVACSPLLADAHCVGRAARLEFHAASGVRCAVLGSSQERGAVCCCYIPLAQRIRRSHERPVGSTKWRGMRHRLDSYQTRQLLQNMRVLGPCVPDSSPSKTLGIPTKSIGIPSSASASIFSCCSRASLDAKPADVYCPLDRPVLGMSSSLGGHGGGGSALEYRIFAM
jgi:hypothetical protein